MKYWTISVLMLLALSTAFSAEQTHPQGIFTSLKVGQHVKLEDHGTAFTISYFKKELELPFKVIEIGRNYVVVRDLADIKETVIPVYAVKAVVKVRMGVE